MEKIISLFKRNYDGDRLVYNEVVPGAEWVLEGEGVATRKYDGTCCMIRDGVYYKRYDAKKGKTPPPDFEPAEPEPNKHTGHWPGWVPVGDGPEDKHHRAAHVVIKKPGVLTLIIQLSQLDDLPDCTYELCGPKVQGNPEGFREMMLIPHGEYRLPTCPRDFEGLRVYLLENDIEGIVWHHPDGRMVKIKKKDFGFKR